MTTIAQDLGGVVRLLEKATAGRWYVEPMGENEFGQPAYSVNMEDGRIPTVESGEFYGDPHDANAACAAVNFLRTHSAEIAGALRDAERYRWLKDKANYARNSDPIVVFGPKHDKMLEGPLLDAAIDSAMQQGGGGGE